MDKVLELSSDLLYFEIPLMALLILFLGKAFFSSKSKREKIVFVDISIFFLALFMCLNFALWMTFGVMMKEGTSVLGVIMEEETSVLEVIMKEETSLLGVAFFIGTGGLISLLIYLSSLLTHEE